MGNTILLFIKSF